MPTATPKRISSEQRRAQILKVATELFAARGFEGTTTREIARRARVNEAILFRHFTTKEELYWAVIENKCANNHARQNLSEILGSQADFRSKLVALAEAMLTRREKDSTMMRLFLFSGLENHQLSHRFFQSYVSDFNEQLEGFFRRAMDGGELRQIDPELAARGFLGMLVYHSLIQELFGGKKVHPFKSQEVAEVVTDIWLKGMETGSEKKSEFSARAASDTTDGRRES